MWHTVGGHTHKHNIELSAALPKELFLLMPQCWTLCRRRAGSTSLESFTEMWQNSKSYERSRTWSGWLTERAFPLQNSNSFLRVPTAVSLHGFQDKCYPYPQLLLPPLDGFEQSQHAFQPTLYTEYGFICEGWMATKNKLLRNNMFSEDVWWPSCGNSLC